MVASKIYYAGYDTANGRELYRFDPNSGQTSRLSDINPGSGSSQIDYLTPYKGKLYFVGNDGNTGQEPYVYDPNTNQVSLLMEIDTGNEETNPCILLCIFPCHV